jgi:hypothetical protein
MIKGPLRRNVHTLSPNTQFKGRTLKVKNQEAVYWENFNLGDIVRGMPILYMPGKANCIARLFNKRGIHNT